MSTSPKHDVRRRYRETRRKQFQRLLEILDSAIGLSRQHVIIPACDFPLLYELLAEREAKMRDDDWREMVSEIVTMFQDRQS